MLEPTASKAADSTAVDHAGEGESDTVRLLSALLQAAGGGDDDAVPQVLGALRGPWAFAFWHAASRTLWYGRDSFGRRSLLRAEAQGCGCEVP